MTGLWRVAGQRPPKPQEQERILSGIIRIGTATLGKGHTRVITTGATWRV